MSTWRLNGMRTRARLVIVAATITLFPVITAEQIEAQSGRSMAIDDQPGVVPDPRDERLPTAFQRQAVFYRTNEPPGTIIVDTAHRYLYIQGNNRAIRYGIGVGREGFQWQGLLQISRKGEWPDWTPPPEMIQRQPYLPRFMAGGPGNPMGARALYLGATIYRIHGTNQPQQLEVPCLLGVFVWSTMTLSICTSGSRLAPRSSCDNVQACEMLSLVQSSIFFGFVETAHVWPLTYATPDFG